ncbi:hypothetical protein H6P81_003009 [Aristolochia fimbriata]|uniref:RING-type domain-containing protein n=1 Tax=Aristolochia fimbriata TaxID=158543 RepID=A0AAV7FEK1_ARIFI|nr:hypothetical protein H6P81_003009 [Aristolochia fimbriata]
MCLFMSAIRSLVAGLYLLVGAHSARDLSFPFRPISIAKEAELLGRNRRRQEEIGIKYWRARGVGGEDEDCAVCMSKMKRGGGATELRCGHLFHTECLDQWCSVGGATCPFCRSSLRGDGTAVLETEVEEDPTHLGFSLHPLLHIQPHDSWRLRERPFYWLER